MQGRKFSLGMILVLAMVGVALLMTSMDLAAQTENVLYSFAAVGGGASPLGSLTFDAAGNLYGTGFGGGVYGHGMVFELSPAEGGMWTGKVLYSFNPSNGTDGSNPEAGVVLDAAGNLYGTDASGGTNNLGTVFELPTSFVRGWSDKVLREFGSSTDGYQPASPLVLDASGKLYGTTSGGGRFGGGMVFELMPQGNGTWRENVLHNFINNNRDGAESYAGLTFDAAGNLFGTTCVGGANNEGTVFELSPAAGGAWSEKVIYSFRGKVNHFADGWCPQAGVAFDAAGNLYGTTAYGGPGNNYGIVFQLSPLPGGGWKETIIHSFNKDGVDGYLPLGNLAVDSAGSVYGVTHNGGPSDYGTVFKLTASGSGWTETILHDFNNDGADGYYPVGGLILDGAGDIFGTTSRGGTLGGGTAFEITP